MKVERTVSGSTGRGSRSPRVSDLTNYLPGFDGSPRSDGVIDLGQVGVDGGYVADAVDVSMVNDDELSVQHGQNPRWGVFKFPCNI